MSWLPGLAFAAPWALGLLALLPLLWRLLRVTPPAPRRIAFPAIRLLLGLEPGSQTAEATPPWLVALRLGLATMLILAAARPLLDPAPRRAESGALVAVIDDGWAAARDWNGRREHLDRRLAAAEREGRPVLLLTTAPPADGGALPPPSLTSATEARAALAALLPKPWPTDRAAAALALKAGFSGRAAQVVWLSDSQGGGGAELARALQSLGGGLDLVEAASGRILMPPPEDAGTQRLAPTVRRLPLPGGEGVAVIGRDAAGAVLARGEATFEPGQSEIAVPLDLPTELRNRLVRLDIEGEAGAGATVLLDERWRRRPVGLTGGGGEGGVPLLDRLYYVERALAPYAELRRDDLPALVAEDGPPVLVLADLPLVPGPLTDKLAARVNQGVVLIRFAGPLLAAAGTDSLLPVSLRGGGRALGGAMSWTTPMALAPFGESSPFRDLPIPADVEIRSQVLAEPSLDLAGKVWAGLADGTPLVTAERRGKGWVVLIHTSANADWSNLALSGLFVDMLRRLAGLAQSGGGTSAAGPLAPSETLDGFGHLAPAAGAVQPMTTGMDRTEPGPRHPPGYYGPPNGRIAFNLGPRLDPPHAVAPPPGATRSGLSPKHRETDLAPALLVAALILALADAVASLALRGIWRRAALVALALGAATPADAADASVEAALATRLACVRTNEPAVDRDCMAGLKGLSQVIAERSTANLAEPMLVDLDRDPVAVFPLLYWRVTAGQKPPSSFAVERLNAYMAHGGLIVFDTADEGQPGVGPDTAELTRLRMLVEGLTLPPLAPLASDHVLNRAFYLLKESPGRWDGATVWVEQGDGGGGNDGVTPVLLGGNDWVGAWAVDDHRRPLHAVVPGGERQREMAYRFGINLVMVALTGNYKADQVHLPAIMERLGR